MNFSPILQILNRQAEDELLTNFEKVTDYSASIANERAEESQLLNEYYNKLKTMSNDNYKKDKFMSMFFFVENGGIL